MKVSFDIDGSLRGYDGKDLKKTQQLLLNHVKQGDEVVVVTRRSEDDIHQKMDGLQIRGYINKISPVPVYFTNREDKWGLLKKLGVKLHYDDDPKEIELIQKHTDIKTVLVDEDESEERKEKLELVPVNFKSKSCLVIDWGCYVEVAIRLAKDFGKVYYYTPWNRVYPTSMEKSIGKGLEDENVYRIDDYEDILDKTDLVVIPAGNTGVLVESLRNRGLRVWGGGRGEELEYDRESAKEYMDHLKMPVNKYEVITGVDKAREYLKDEKNENKFIKNDIRGSFESFHHEKWRLTQPIFESIVKDLGATGSEFKFIIEDPIPDAVEYGYDGYSIDGKYPENTLMGIEIKDCFYVSCVKPMPVISKLITDPMHKISSFLKAKKYRQTISTECRITKDKKAYVIDFTCRTPSPPGEIYQVILKNFTEIYWHGADGKLIQPLFESKYAIEAIIQSSWAAGDGEQAIYFPKEIRDFVKIKNLYKANDTYYFLPVGGGYNEIGAVVAIGNSIEDCHKKLKEYADKIEGYKLYIPVGSIDKAMEEVKKGESIGIKF